MAEVSEEKRAWLTAVFGIAWPDEGEDDESEAEELDGDTDSGDEADEGDEEGGEGGKRRRRGGRGKGKGAEAPISEEQARKVAVLLKTATQSYQSAMSEVSGQVADLGKELAKSPDEELKTIGRLGLADVLASGRVALNAYLQQIGDGSDLEKLRKVAPKLLGAANDYSSALLADPRVAVMDDNPFSVTVSIRDTLVPAILTIADAARGG